MTYVTVVDAEDVVKAWLLTTSVATLVTVSGKTHIYMAMPTGSPLPSLILSRVGGSPRADSDVSEDIARISFRIYGSKRTEVKAIAKALVSEVESLAYTGSVSTASGRLVAAQTLNWFWSPDPVSDTPRYMVDILATVHS